MFSTNNKVFIFLPSSYTFYFFFNLSSFIALATISRIKMNRRCDNGHPSLLSINNTEYDDSNSFL